MQSSHLIHARRYGVLVVEGKTGVIRSASADTCRLFGYESGALIGKRVTILMESAYAEQYERYAEIHFAGGLKAEVASSRVVTGKRADGSLVKLRLSLSLEPSDTCPLVCALMEKLDERCITLTVDPASQRILSARGDALLFGCPVADMVGKRADAYFSEGLSHKQPGVMRNLKARHQSGPLFPVAVELMSEPEADALTVLVTQIDSALEGVVNVDCNGMITSVSSSCRLLFGYAADEMTGCKFDQFLGHVRLSTGQGVVSCAHKDGSRFFLMASITESLGADGRAHYKAIVRRSINSRSLAKLATAKQSVDSAADELVGWYSVSRVLGLGGFGSVKHARHRLTGYEVAIKSLEQKCYEAAKMAFPPREIELMWRLKHPNIVHLYDILYADKVVYLIMDVVRGGELFDYVLQKQRLAEEEAQKYFAEMVSAVDYMHRSGVVHRDLKLENVMLDERGHVKIIDFGLGNFFDAKKPLSTFCGTPDYCAPELFFGKTYVGPEVDIWALGVILYIMVAGYVPFCDTHELMNISYRFPPGLTLSAPLVNLIGGIFQPSAKRLSMTAILKHEWVLKRERIDIRKPVTALNPVIVKQMQEMGFSEADVKKAVLSDAHDQISTTYYLIAHNTTSAQASPESPSQKKESECSIQ